VASQRLARRHPNGVQAGAAGHLDAVAALEGPGQPGLDLRNVDLALGFGIDRLVLMRPQA
jgi:hypothetical protein